MDAVKKRLKNCRRLSIWLFSRLGLDLFAYGKESSPTVAISRNSGFQLTPTFRSHRFSTKTLFKPSAIVAHCKLNKDAPRVCARLLGLVVRIDGIIFTLPILLYFPIPYHYRCKEHTQCLIANSFNTRSIRW